MFKSRFRFIRGIKKFIEVKDTTKKDSNGRLIKKYTIKDFIKWRVNHE